MILSDGTLKHLIALNFISAASNLALAIVTGIIGNLDMKPRFFSTKLLTISDGHNPPSYSSFVEETPYGSFPITIFALVAFSFSAFIDLGNLFVWTRLYFDKLEEVSSPYRWTSNLVTNLFLTIIVAYIAGVRSLYTIMGVSACSVTSSALLYVTEVFNRPREDVDSWNTLNILVRAKPHLLALLPFAVLWAVILMQFSNGVSCIAKPAIWAIVFMSFAFGVFNFLPQVFQLLKKPSLWIVGEQRYILLSMLHNLVVGILLNIYVVSKKSFDNAIIKSEPCLA